MERRTRKLAAAAFGLAVVAGVGIASSKDCCWQTREPAQIVGDTDNTEGCWDVVPLVTIGEQTASGDDVNAEKIGYMAPGLLDGIGAWKWSKHTVRVLVNSEYGAGDGHAYELANGTEVKGARISYFDIDAKSREVCGAGLAFCRIYDRAGEEVTSAKQINEGSSETDGFHRFCSGHGFKKGEKGFRNAIYFCGEETTDGQACATDVKNKDLYVVPMLGRIAFENVCALENFGTKKIVMLIGDDNGDSPLWLYVGERGAEPKEGDYCPPKFLRRNGLGYGKLFAWVADSTDEFSGTGACRKGKFKRVTHFDPSMAGASGWDSLGFANTATTRANADGVGATRFARPEDVSANPCDGTQVVFNATGGGADWGTVYILDVDDCDLEKKLSEDLCDVDCIAAKIKIIYDGNDAGGGQFSDPDYGIRSPDNLDWADDGKIYVQEDKSADDFGATSGIEASVYSLDPCSGKVKRLLEIDRDAIPTGQSDSGAGDTGNWESSGVLDVTDLFKTRKGETLLILDVQAHGLRDGLISSESLVQGGQLVLASKIDKKCKDWDSYRDCDDDCVADQCDDNKDDGCGKK